MTVKYTKVDDIVRKHYNPYFKTLSERGKSFEQFRYPHYLEVEELDKRYDWDKFIKQKLFPNGDENKLFEKHYPFVFELMKLDRLSFVEKRELFIIYHSIKEEEDRFEEWISTPSNLDEFL